MIFKLLALRLNAGTPLRKNLIANQLYKFSEDYEFLNEKEELLHSIGSFHEIARIKDQHSFPADLYQIGDKKAPIDICISAIVGRNGAGKSSLLEAFYLFIFCLAENKRMIGHREDLDRKIKASDNAALWQSLRIKTDSLLKETDMEFYYRMGDEYFLMRRQGGQTDQYRLIKSKWKQEAFAPSAFFYSIIVNYSQYGLNASGDYYWLKPLFHKNDRYKTPIVLNPFRDAGNIDINREMHLAQTRMLTNLSHGSFRTRKLIDDKEISEIKFYIRPSRNGVIHDIGTNRDSLTLYDAVRTLNTSKELYDRVSQNTRLLLRFFEDLLFFFDPDIKQTAFYLTIKNQLNSYLSGKNTNTLIYKIYSEGKSIPFTADDFRLQLAVYIITKSIKICNKHPDKFQYSTNYLYYDDPETNKEVAILWIKDRGYAFELYEDNSHVTLKLKQAVNLLLSDRFSTVKWESTSDDQDEGFAAYYTTISFDKVLSDIRLAFKNSSFKGKHLSHFIPAAFLTPEISIESQEGSYLFSQMSSGEQQLIHSVHSVLYHLLNLNSITESQVSGKENQPPSLRNPDTYQFVNLILDEIELYYHPIYQRQFIHFLIESINKINLRYIKGLNIIFSTHSPFILSDIPKSNVLRLQAGQAPSFQLDQTFSANIHDMLSDSFFMDQSLIGAFAEEKINECIRHINQLRLLKIAGKETERERVRQLRTEIKSLKCRKHYRTYAAAVKSERKTRHIHDLIELMGEPVMRFKLKEMYEEAMPEDQFTKADIKRQIMEMMQRNNLTKEDL